MSARPLPPAPLRLSHAERTRREILDVAVGLAATEGLESLTIGRLATAVGMSKGGLFAHFGSKEALQVATVDTAHQQFLEEVFAAVAEAAPGLNQLRAFLEQYFAYLERRRDRGGCFFTPAALEYDDRPGPVRDRIAEILRTRNDLVRATLQAAVDAGELQPDVDVEQLAFEAVTIASGVNVDLRILGNGDGLARARTALEARLVHCLRTSPAKKAVRGKAKA